MPAQPSLERPFLLCVMSCALLLQGCGGGAASTAAISAGDASACGPKILPVVVEGYELTVLPGGSNPEWPRASFALRLQMAAWHELSQIVPAAPARARLQWLIPSALACPPSFFVSEQTLMDFSVTSSQPYAQGYPAGAELKALFKAELDYGHTLATLDSYPAAGELAPVDMLLSPIAAAAPGARTFTVTLTFDQGDAFQLTAQVDGPR